MKTTPKEFAEANPTGAAGVASVGFVVHYLDNAGPRLSPDARILLDGLRLLPRAAVGYEEWARSLDTLLAGFRLPTPEVLASRSTELTLALRAAESALWAGRGDAITAARSLLVSGFMSGGLAGILGGLNPEGVEFAGRVEFAKSGASARWESDPRTLARARIQERWEAWQSGGELHKSQAAFARAMVNAFPQITSTATVEKWVRNWAKQRKAEREAAGN